MNLSPDDLQLEQELRDLPLCSPSVVQRQKQWERIAREVIGIKRSTVRRFSYVALGSFAIVTLVFGAFQQYSGTMFGGGSHIEAPPIPPAQVDPGFVAVKYPQHGTVFENQEQLSAEDQAKAAVLEKMGFAYENIQTMQAKALAMNNSVLGDGKEQHIEVTMRQGLYPAVYELIRQQDGNSMQYVTNNQYMWIKSSNSPEMVNMLQPFNPDIMPVGSGGFVNTQGGQKSYGVPADPAHSMWCERIVAPLRHLPGYLLDIQYWKIVGDEQVLGRTATRLEGKLDDYFSQKMKAINYKVWIDKETGILLKSALYDDKGQQVEAFEVISLELNVAIDTKRFDIPQDVIQKQAGPIGNIKK